MLDPNEMITAAGVPTELLNNEQKLIVKTATGVRKLANEDQIIELASKGLSMGHISALFGRAPTFIETHYKQTWLLGRSIMFEKVMNVIVEKGIDERNLQALDILRKELSDKEPPAVVNINVNTQLPQTLMSANIIDLNDLSSS